MKNSEFYQQVLGLQWRWRVDQVELDHIAQRVVVHVGVEPGTKWADPATHGRAHVYATLLNDLDSGRVWDLVEGRKEEQARQLLQELDATQRAGVKAVAMDWTAYRNAVERLLPKADIVHDKFHLCAYLNKPVETVGMVQ